MIQAKLIRLEESDQGTLGALLVNGVLIAATLEPEDRDNEQFVSCIPTGAYICKRRFSARYGWTFEICDVQDRTDILFHPGNWITDTLGCVVVGQYWGKLTGNRAVLNSGNTFNMLIDLLDGVDTFGLTVVGVV